MGDRSDIGIFVNLVYLIKYTDNYFDFSNSKQKKNTICKIFVDELSKSMLTHTYAHTHIHIYTSNANEALIKTFNLIAMCALFCIVLACPIVRFVFN